MAHYVTEKTQNYSKTLFFTFHSLCWLLSLLLFVQPLKLRPAQKTKYRLLPASFAFLLPLHQVDCDITCIFVRRLVKLVLSQDGKTPFDNNLSVTAFPGVFDCSLVV